MNPDPQIIAALRYQAARLVEWEARLAGRAAHPPAVSTTSWSGPAAEAHTRASVELRHRVRVAQEALASARHATRSELARAGG